MDRQSAEVNLFRLDLHFSQRYLTVELTKGVASIGFGPQLSHIHKS